MNPENWYVSYPEEYKELYKDIKPTCLIFGGTGGIGTAITPYLNYDIIKYGSNDLDLSNKQVVYNEIKLHNPSIVIYLVGTTYNSFIHKFDNLDSYLSVNINSFVNVLSSSLSIMRENKYGRFIYSSSILSKKYIPGCSLYSSSKLFCENMIKNAAKENGKFNITVNAILLGYFNVGMIEKVPVQVLDKIKQEIPSNKLGDPVQIANLIKTIVNNDYINGSCIELTGGIY